MGDKGYVKYVMKSEPSKYESLRRYKLDFAKTIVKTYGVTKITEMMSTPAGKTNLKKYGVEIKDIKSLVND